MDTIKNLTVCNILSDFYTISDQGEVRNKKRNRVIKPKTDKDGYLSVTLCINDVCFGNTHYRQTFRVAGLVLREFVGYPPKDIKDPTVEHIDGNKSNNAVSNLMWMERSENSSTRENKPVGSKNGSAKLSEEDVVKIKHLLQTTKLTMKEIGQMFDVNVSTINNIKRNKSWKEVN